MQRLPEMVYLLRQPLTHLFFMMIRKNCRTGLNLLLNCVVYIKFWIALFFLIAVSCASNTISNNPEESSKAGRLFIAHRGVNLGCTIAGENSLEAIRLAKRAGFETVETDVRLTSDSVLVVMHDNTLNRTCLNMDGTELKEKVLVAEKTLNELKSGYRLKATETRNRTAIPTLKEYLAGCKECGIVPFIEPKLTDESGAHYIDIIKEADEVMGKNNYIITSNNRANVIIRKLGLLDVPLMGILYQTTFGEIENLGNAIMAISTSQFALNDYYRLVSKAKASGIQTESGADNFSRFMMINNSDIDYVSTDYLAADLKESSFLLFNGGKFDDFKYTGRLSDGTITLEANDSFTLKSGLPEVYFGGIYLELEMKGKCNVVLANQEFSVANSEMSKCKHQVMIYNSSPEFRISAVEKCVIHNICLKLAKF